MTGSGTQYDLTDALGSVLAAFSNTAGMASVLGNQTENGKTGGGLA